MKKLLESLLLMACIGMADQAAIARQQANPALQALDDQLSGDLINDPSNMAWNVQGKNMVMKPLRDSSIPGGGAGISIKVQAQGTNPWDVQAQIPLIGPIESGQPVTVGFYARTVSAATSDKRGEITVRVQQNVSPYAGFIDKILPIGPEWTFYEATAKASRRLNTGEGVVALQFAGAKQEIEIGQMIVVSNATTIVASAPGNAGGSQKAQAQAKVDLSGPPQMPDALKDKGALLVDPRKRDNWAFYGAGITHSAGTSSVMGVPSIKTVTAAAAAQPHEVAITVPLDEPIRKGDALIISIAARANSSDAADGNGKIGVRVMENDPPWPGFGDGSLNFAPGKWQIITLNTTATQDIAAGKGAVQLQLGAAKQDFDIGPVYVIKAKAP
ncbi:MAG: carbohydrate binding domain-containing protein [Sphingobium sp.]|nr:carbohydrate binding domain-containing protein [Sphingobium sp.]